MVLYNPTRWDDTYVAVMRLALALSFLTLSLGGFAQTSAPTAATEPESTTTPDNKRYLAHPELLAECQERLDAVSGKPCDLLFIGASILERWPTVGKAVWEKNFAPRHALDFGISGDKTQNVLWRLNNMSIQSLRPKVAIIQVGTNNTDNTPHEIADGVKAVVANTQSAFPGVKIIIVSLLPNRRANDKMMQANALIRQSADNSTTYYLDLVPLMPPIPNPDGTGEMNWKGIGKDGLHPDATGYQIWADAMEPLLTKLMSGG